MPRGVVVATAAGMLCFALVAGLLARPYLRVLDDHPEGHRSIVTVAHYSGPPYEFLVASGDSRLWGAATSPLRDKLTTVPEKTLFPGLAILVLAIVGLRAPALPRHIRRRLGWGALAFAVLSLGVQLNAVAWLYPYRWLYELLPGWQGIRVPGRLHTLTTLCLALLAAGGAIGARASYARARKGARRTAPPSRAVAVPRDPRRGLGLRRPPDRRARARRASPRRRSPRCTSPPARSTTAATSCGRPTASRRSSTAAAA